VGTIVPRVNHEKKTRPLSTRDRILEAAYPMFIARGIRDVTMDEILHAAGTTAAEFASVFESRDALATECLMRRERDWTLGIVEAGARARGGSPEEQLLAIFDVFNDWFHRDDYEACTFINVLLEMGREHPLGEASMHHLNHIRSIVSTLAAEAHLTDPDTFALSWHILMKGSIINAVEGDTEAAHRARTMAEDLIARHRPRRIVEAPNHGLVWLEDYNLGIEDYFATDKAAHVPSDIVEYDWDY
jgi:AcrR family transcriptional regulator